jgi:hypothetical protein
MKASTSTHVVLTLLIVGCAIPPREMVKDILNVSEPHKINEYALPSNWDIYRASLEDLIGAFVFIIPENDNDTIFKPKIFDVSLTDSGKKEIRKEATSEIIYSSTVDASFGANLSFMIGKGDFKKDHIYEMNMKEITLAKIPPNSDFIDTTKLNKILSKCPQRFKEAFWITGLKHNAISIKDFWHIGGKSEASTTIMKVDGSYFTNDGKTSIENSIYFVGTDKSDIFGTYSNSTKMYVRNNNIRKNLDEKRVFEFDENESKKIQNAVQLLDPKEIIKLH